jgi:dTDP-4-amino-4,6-dideoxygalactose transaminase/predicted dehydrogenase
MFGKIKQKLNGPLTERMYKYLMREAQYHLGRKPFGPQELKLLNEALVSQTLFGVDGKMVNTFEKEFAQLYNVPYAVASTSGTAAIHTALGVLDLNPGDEVITAPITDLGTVIPILSLNAIPVFADVDHMYSMDPSDVERKITSRTKAIVVVHLFGNPCDMDAMVAIARKHNIPLIEDCAQSHVTEYKGKYVGTIGDIGCFSFQQSKHMTTGDGGMCVTSNKAFYDRMKLYVDKGFMRKGWGTRAYGFHAPNYRMNELTGAVGRAQLAKVKNVVRTRNVMGTLMTKLIADVGEIVTAPITEGATHSYWLYPIYLKKGDLESFAKTMASAGFWCGAGYTGKPIYLCTESLTAKKTYGTSKFPFDSAFTSKSYEYVEGLCPKAEETLKHLVTMPWDESWGEEKVKKAAAALKETVRKFSGGATVAVSKPVVQAVDTGKTVSANATKKIRIGIIGCGQMGEWHWDAYRKNPNVECVAFVDTDRSRAERFVSKTPGNIYTDYREMIKQEKLDGVSICTLPSTHHPIVMDLLNAGVHVLCEKPLAMSVDEARAMTQKANEKNLRLLTAFKFRFFDEVQEAKAILQKGSLGKILNFRVMIGGQTDMAGTWFVNKDLSGGGVVIDNGPHAFDLVRYLLGDIDSVRAQVGHYQDLPVEDTAQLACRLKNGGTGTVDISWNLPTPSKNYCEIYGEEGTILLDFSGLTYKFKTWNEWKVLPNKASNKEAFNRQIDHFINAIAGTPASVTTNEDGLKAQELIELAYKSL